MPPPWRHQDSFALALIGLFAALAIWLGIGCYDALIVGKAKAEARIQTMERELADLQSAVQKKYQTQIDDTNRAIAVAEREITLTENALERAERGADAQKTTLSERRTSLIKTQADASARRQQFEASKRLQEDQLDAVFDDTGTLVRLKDSPVNTFCDVVNQVIAYEFELCTKARRAEAQLQRLYTDAKDLQETAQRIDTGLQTLQSRLNDTTNQLAQYRDDRQSRVAAIQEARRQRRNLENRAEQELQTLLDTHQPQIQAARQTMARFGPVALRGGWDALEWWHHLGTALISLAMAALVLVRLLQFRGLWGSLRIHNEDGA